MKLFKYTAKLPHMNSFELCASAGGQRQGRSARDSNMGQFDASRYKCIDLVTGGFPRLPFCRAANSLCDASEGNLLPDRIRFVKEIRPRVAMIKDGRGILDAALEGRSGVATEYHA